MDNKELVLKAKERVGGALEELINKYRPYIVKRSTCVYINGYEMEDLIQLGNESLIKAVDKYDINRGNFTAYVNSAIDKNFNYLIRSKAKENHIISIHTPINDVGNELQDILIKDDNFEEKIIDRETKKMINNYIERLPEDLKSIVKVWVEKRWSMREYAKESGINYSTLMKRKEKAFKLIRKYIEENELI